MMNTASELHFDMLKKVVLCYPIISYKEVNWRNL